MRRFATIFAVFALLMLVIAPASAGPPPPDENGATKVQLEAEGSASCLGDGIQFSDGETRSFVVLNYNGTDVSATVSLKKAEPNATYNLRLIQSEGTCFEVDTSFTTNGQGNGTVHWSEEALGESGFAFVHVDIDTPEPGFVSQTMTW